MVTIRYDAVVFGEGVRALGPVPFDAAERLRRRGRFVWLGGDGSPPWDDPPCVEVALPAFPAGTVRLMFWSDRAWLAAADARLRPSRLLGERTETAEETVLHATVGGLIDLLTRMCLRRLEVADEITRLAVIHELRASELRAVLVRVHLDVVRLRALVRRLDDRIDDVLLCDGRHWRPAPDLTHRLARLARVTDAAHEMVADLLDRHDRTDSAHVERTMRVLTVATAALAAANLVAGTYGMNFDPAVSPWNMPELRWPFGYVFALGLMAAAAAGTAVAVLSALRPDRLDPTTRAHLCRITTLLEEAFELDDSGSLRDDQVVLK